MRMKFAISFLLVGAALINFFFSTESLQNSWPWAVIALLQISFVVALLYRNWRPLPLIGIVGNIAVIVYWINGFSQITGPSSPINEQGAFSFILEITSAVLLALLFFRAPHSNKRFGVGPVVAALVCLPLVVVALMMSFSKPVSSIRMSMVPVGMGTSVTKLVAAPGKEPIKKFTLTAQMSKDKGVEQWTYNGVVPGPVLTVNQGDRVVVTLVNHLPVSTSIHWHGISVPNADDGVAGVTQDAVKPGDSFTYEFVAKDPGTYWYHSHQDTWGQIPKGLFGAFVVKPIGGALEDVDYSVILHDSPGGPAFNNHTGNLSLSAKSGQKVRLRIIDAVQGDMQGTPQEVVLVGAKYKIVAADGHDLNGPQELGPQDIKMGMGQRYDFVFTMPEGHTSVALVDRGGKGDYVTIGSGNDPSAPDWKLLKTFDLTSYGEKTEDPLTSASKFDQTFQYVLANHPAFRNYGIELVHTIDGESSDHPTMFTVKEGQTIKLHIVNNTDEGHPIHLHGHVMTVLAKNGHFLTGSPVHQDTVLIGPKETWDVAFVANNPGLWMTHCHILIHSAFGMSAMINYEGISTPFTVGTTSGNIPE